MSRNILALLAIGLCVTITGAFAHPGHTEPAVVDTEDGVIVLAQNDTVSPDAVSGQDEYRFRVLYTSEHLPSLAQRVLVRAHGGFAVDRREGRGEVYFALPGAGIIQISNDFGLVRMLNSPEEIRATNMHNATLWFDDDENGYIAFPANDGRKVFTTTMTGILKHTLEAPTADITFNSDRVNKWFAEGNPLVPTDVEYVNGTYYITTGYSRLDHVLTASVNVTPPDPAAVAAQEERVRRFRGPLGPTIDASWNELAFGGRGNRPGKFGTGHGITLHPDGESIVVADRPHSEIDRFSFAGEHLDTTNIPEGAWPCDVDYEAGYTLVGCLHGPDREKGAPIYIMKGDEVLSTIMPKEDLGLSRFQHIHNAVLIQRNGKLYIIAQAWNPGDFAILEQVQ